MQHILRVLALGALVAALAAGAQAQTATTIYDIQQGMHAQGTHVGITGAVIVGVDSRPTSFGLYIQAPAGGAYSGILVFLNTRPLNQAYDNAIGTIPLVGDVVDVTGAYSEFGGLSEILAQAVPVIPLVINKTGTTTPLTPVKLPVDSLKVNYPGSERWEGVLVRVDSIQVTSLNTFNDWRFHHFAGPVAGRVDSLVGYEKMISGQVVPGIGDRLNVVGVADYAFSERRIAPRGDADLTFLTPTPAAVPNLAYSPADNRIKVRFNVPLNVGDATNASNYTLSTFQGITMATYDAAAKMVTLTVGTPLVPSVTPHVLSMSGIRNNQGVPMNGIQTISFIGGVTTIEFIQTPVSASNDSSQVANQQVTFRGVVTETTGGATPDFPSSAGGFYIQQRGATQYGGLFVFGPPTFPVKNDSVLVSGIVSEFGVGPETEIVSVDEVTILGSNRPPIAPVAATLANASGSNLTEAEKYEGMLIRIANVRSLTQASFGNPFDISQTLTGTDTLRVDDLAVEESAYAPWRNDNLDVTGIIRFSGTAPFRRLQPRNWNEPPVGDIHVIAKANVSDAPPAVLGTQLLQNVPNPFNPTTVIEFTLERAGEATVSVYDVDGKLVQTVWDGPARAGTLNRAVWDGRDAGGHSVGSGVYFYRLHAGDVVQTRKMMLLK
jgi:hypothetical protein